MTELQKKNFLIQAGFIENKIVELKKEVDRILLNKEVSSIDKVELLEWLEENKLLRYI